MKRRQFLGGALGMSVFGIVLAGCGGGNSSNDDSGGTTSQNIVSGRVQLPSGITVPMNQLQLLSGTATATVAASGDFQLAMLAGTPTLATLYWNDSPLLLGMLDGTTSGTIDANSTATALLFLALGGWQFALDQRAPFLALIAAHPATATFGQTIAERVLANPRALEEQDAQIVTALQTAVSSITPNAVATTQSRAQRTRGRQAPALTPSLLINPTGPVSGMEVVQDGDKLAGFSVINSQRRDRRVHVYRVGKIDSATNAQTSYPSAIPVGDPLNVPATQRLGLVESLTDILNATSPWSPTQSSRVQLPQEDGAKKTFYHLIALYPSFGSAAALEPDFFSESIYASQVAEWRTEIGDMNLSAFFELTFAVFLETLGVGGLKFTSSQLTKAIGDIQANTTDVAALAAEIRNSGPLPAFLKRAIIMAANSDIVSKGYLFVLEPLYKQVQGHIDDQVRSLSRLRTALRVLAIVGLAASALDIGAQVQDLSDGGKGHRVTADVYVPTVRLSPSSTVLNPGDSTTFSANIPALANTEIVYAWRVTGSPLANLSEATETKVGTEFETHGKVVTLATTPSTTGPLTVSVTAYTVAANDTRTSLGDASGTVTFAVKDDFPAYGTTRIQFNGLSTGALAVSAAQRTFVQTTDFPATLRSGNPDVLNFISSQPTVAAHEENLAAEIWFEPTIKTGAVIGIGQGTNSQFTLKLVSDFGQEVYLGIVSGTFTLRSYTVTASTYKIEGTLFGKRDTNISGSVSISGWILM